MYVRVLLALWVEILRLTLETKAGEGIRVM